MVQQQSGFLVRIFLLQNCALLAGIMCATIFYFPGDSSPLWISHYLVSLFSVCVIGIFFVSFMQNQISPYKPWRKERADIGVFSVLLFLAAYIRFRGLETFDIWLDEDQQIVGLMAIKDPQRSALNAFQSPLDYILNYPIVQYGGADLFLARIWSATMGTLTVSLAYILARGHARVWIAALVGLLCVFHPWLLAYSRECRPYIGSVFVFAVTLQWLWWAWDSEHQRHARYGFIIGMIVLFYYSAILPIIMLGILGLVLIGYRRQKPKFVQWYWTGFIIAAALWAPFYLAMAGQHNVGNPNVAIWDLFAGIRSYGSSVKGVLGWSAPGLALIALVLKNKSFGSFVFPLMVLALVYPLGMFFFSSPGLHAYFAERFVLLYGFLVLIAIGFALEEFEKLNYARWWKWGAASAGGIGVILFAQTNSMKIQESAWRKVHEILNAESEAGGLAAIFTPLPDGTYTTSGFVGAEIYFRAEEKMKVISNWTVYAGQVITLINALKEVPNPKYIYLFSNHDDKGPRRAFPAEGVAGLKRFSVTDTKELLRLETKDAPMSQLRNFFRHLQRHNTEEEINFRYVEMLLGLALAQNDCAEAGARNEQLANDERFLKYSSDREYLIKMLYEVCEEEPKGT